MSLCAEKKAFYCFVSVWLCVRERSGTEQTGELSQRPECGPAPVFCTAGELRIVFAFVDANLGGGE